MQAHTTRTSLVRFAKCGMTLVSCNSKNEANAKSLELNEITTSCATPRNDKYVSEAHRKELNVLTSYRLNDFKKKIAFTLAEVLITLGIIGVVAAMTIPTFIANYQEKQTISRLQKTYATLKNAFEMAKVEHGDYNTWSWNQYPSQYSSKAEYFWEKYLFSYLKVSQKCFPFDKCGDVVIRLSNDSMYSYVDEGFILNDGTIIYTWAGAETYYPHIWIYADINGKSEPNVLGKDIFVMYFSPGNPGKSAGNTNDDGDFENSGKTFNIGYGLRLFGEGSGYTAEEMMQPNFVIEDNPGVFQNFACNVKSGGQICGAVIQLNGWKFPDGYLE